MQRTVLVLLASALALILLAGVYLLGRNQQPKPQPTTTASTNPTASGTASPIPTQTATTTTPISVNSFDECVAAGYPVQETYPARCVGPNQVVFSQDIGNELELAHLIQLAQPRPQETVRSPLQLQGQARGNWYFEAEFLARIYDATGQQLGMAIITTRDDWMTSEFVAFDGELSFDTPQTATGRLIIEKSNPSGLPENAAQLEVPVRFRP